MKTWLLSIECLKANHAPTTLYFSDNGYSSTTKAIQPNRLKQPALLNVSPNDGGVFKLFNSASIGEIELHNNDNALDYLKVDALFYIGFGQFDHCQHAHEWEVSRGDSPAYAKFSAH